MNITGAPPASISVSNLSPDIHSRLTLLSTWRPVLTKVLGFDRSMYVVVVAKTISVNIKGSESTITIELSSRRNLRSVFLHPSMKHELEASIYG